MSLWTRRKAERGSQSPSTRQCQHGGQHPASCPAWVSTERRLQVHARQRFSRRGSGRGGSPHIKARRSGSTRPGPSPAARRGGAEPAGPGTSSALPAGMETKAFASLSPSRAGGTGAVRAAGQLARRGSPHGRAPGTAPRAARAPCCHGRPRLRRAWAARAARRAGGAPHPRVRPGLSAGRSPALRPAGRGRCPTGAPGSAPLPQAPAGRAQRAAPLAAPCGRRRALGTHRRRPHLADAGLLGDGSDLVDEGEGVRELLPAGLEHGALGRRQELGHGRARAPAAPQPAASEQSTNRRWSSSAARAGRAPPPSRERKESGRPGAVARPPPLRLGERACPRGSHAPWGGPLCQGLPPAGQGVPGAHGAPIKAPLLQGEGDSGAQVVCCRGALRPTEYRLLGL